VEAMQMEEPLPQDVLDRLSRDFGDRADAVAALLLAHRHIGSGNFLGNRTIRCIVYAAGGDEHRIQQLLDPGRQDYRDAIRAGEYDGAGRRVRDLNATFLIDSPEKFWASGVANLMDSRGYRLTALETQPATTDPFAARTEYEGWATFIGPKGEIVIEMKDRQWLIHGNRRELEIRDLDRPYTDHSVFLDKVSGYLLSKVRARAAGGPEEAPPAPVARRPWWRIWR
jgi:hypothetical protein